MNKRISVGLTSILLALGFAASGRCQTYFVSTPVSGNCDLDVNYFNPEATQWGPGFGGSVSYGTLDDTLYYDPMSNTLRQVGTITLNPGTFSTQFTAYNWNGDNTSTMLTGLVSVSLTIGTISFDTGVISASLNGNFNLPYLVIPITGSYTLDTGGDEYTGVLSYDPPIPAMDVTYISSVTSTSLTFSVSGEAQENKLPVLASVTASNGFDLILIGGGNDGGYYGGWSVPPVTAQAIPEPSTLLLLLLGASSLMALRPRWR